MKTHINLFFALLAGSLIVISCKKNKADDQDHHHGTGGSGNLMLKVNFKGGTAPFSMDSVYNDGFGNNYKFNLVKIYIGNIGFEDHDANVTNASKQFLLLDPATSDYSLGTIAANHYHVLNFNIGLDSATNHADPNGYDPSSPLYPQSPSVHWSWNSGYIFYRLEGVADTNNDLTFESTFALHVGSDMLTRSSSLTIHTDVAKDQNNTININADITKFLTNVDLDSERVTHTMDNMPLATKVANNSTTVFTAP